MTEAVQLARGAEPAFSVSLLQPFGVLLQPRHGSVELESISHAYLEGLAREHLVVVLRGVEQRRISSSLLQTYAEGFGELLEWPFGYVLDVKVEEDAKNYLFTRHRVEFHCDGVFAQAEPHYLFFHCAEAPSAGGETLLSDTQRVWKAATADEKQWLANLTCRYVQPLTAHYGGEKQLRVLARHPHTGVDVLRYAEPVAGPGGNAPEVIVDGQVDPKETQRLAEYMADVLYRPGVCFTHRWQSGDLMLLDNHRLLHGRRAFGEPCRRHLRRVHVL